MANTQKTPLNEKYLVIGLGQSGISVAQFFAQKEIEFDVQDDRKSPPCLDLFKQLKVEASFINEALSLELMQKYEGVVVSPGVSVQSNMFANLRKGEADIIGDIELFARYNEKPVIAITGSNGKTTVTAMMGEVLKACGIQVGVGGNIGHAALGLLSEDNDFNVLELSSFQLETTASLAPTVSVVLNVSEDHMDRYDNFESYQSAKLSIHNNSGLVIFNRDDESTFYDTEEFLTFGLSEPDHEDDFGIMNINGTTWLCKGQTELIDCNDLGVKGKHNWANCLAVLAIADVLDLSLVKTIDALVAFKGINHRYECVDNRHEIVWINDSKATNPGATLAAIDDAESNIILIVGGQSKQADLSVLNAAVKQHVGAAIVMGEDADLFLAQWKGLTQLHSVDSMQQAVEKAKDLAQINDCVLLSPACASFDMYSGYEARGDDFKHWVRLVNA